MDRIRRLTVELDNTKDEFFDFAPDLCCVADRLGYLKKINKSWEKILGWSEDELLSVPFIDFVHPDDVEKTRDILEYMSEHDIVRFHNRYRIKSNIGEDDFIVLEWNATSWRNGLTYAIGRQVPLSCSKCKDAESRFSSVYRSGNRHDPKRRNY
jgi:PAS domain S-box-containing protein